MPPKANVAARGRTPTSRSAAAKPSAKPVAKPGAKSAPAPVVTDPSKEEPALTVAEAEARIAEVTEDQWKELAQLEDPPDRTARVLRAVLLLIGHPDASNWVAARTLLEEPILLLRELQALGPWGFTENQLQIAAAEGQDVASPPSTPAVASSAAAKARPRGAVAKSSAAKAKAATTPATVPATPGSAASAALLALIGALLAARHTDKPPAFPMVWPVVPFVQLHQRLQQARFHRQNSCVVCTDLTALRALMLHLQRCGAASCDLKRMQVDINLAKTLSSNSARQELGACLRTAMSEGRRLLLYLGDAPPNLRHFCDATQFPIDVFDGEKSEEAARALGLEGVSEGFQIVVAAVMTKLRAEQVLAQVVPAFDDMAVLLLDSASLPALDDLAAEEKALQGRPSLHAGLRILALPAAPPPSAPPASEEPGAGASSSVAAGDVGVIVNSEDFEFVETFGEDWETRWCHGPAKQDENGKPIRESLIHTKLIKYPLNPKDAKPCLQLMGGAAQAPCTGIWTSFSPLIRPTEVEFEFTMNGKVDMPNSCIVFTERAYEGALPDCTVGVQFLVRSGMQLSGGAGNLVRINNDGKIQNDKWNKVLLTINWDEKCVVAQVDTRGKGYVPAVQTVPFRDPTCAGFGFLYIYNTDVQGTSWFHALRIKQEGGAEMMATDALDARAHLAARLQQRQYQKAVDGDMEVGMKMGAIKCTKEHGMNLAEEQRANNSCGAIG